MTTLDAHMPPPAQPPQHRLNWSPAASATRHLREVLRDVGTARGVGGVYLIWIELGSARHWVFAGEAGDLGSRLPRHQADLDRNGNGAGQLHVAWAPVAAVNRAGILRFLVEMLGPRAADPLSAARPVPVNLPQ